MPLRLAAVAVLALLWSSARAQQQRIAVPFEIVGKGVSRTPHSPRVMLIRQKRAAYAFFPLVKQRDEGLLALKRTWDWRRHMAAVVLPGLLPRDSVLTVRSVGRRRGTVWVDLVVKRGTSKALDYPFVVLRIPRSGYRYDIVRRRTPGITPRNPSSRNRR